MALVLKTSNWSETGEQPVSDIPKPVHDAEIIEFPGAVVRSEYRQPDLGTAEEFYIAEQPFAPQWDWDFRSF
jgi:hypothetical protein